MLLSLRGLSGCVCLAVAVGLLGASTPAEATAARCPAPASTPAPAAAKPAAKPASKSSSAAKAVAAPAAKPRAAVDAGKLMILGDSITHGSSGDWTWRYRLWKHLQASGVKVDFVGPSDDLENIMTSQLGDHDHTYLDPNFDQDHGAQYGRPYFEEDGLIAGKVAQYQPDYLLSLLGISDLAWYGVTPAQLEESARTLVTNARSAKPDVRIVLGKVLPNFRALTDSTFAASIADFNQRLDAVAASMSTTESPVVTADATAEFRPVEDTWDGTHPNPRGEFAIAAAFADALATKFGVGAAYPRPFPDVAIGPQQPPQVNVVSTGPSTADMTWTPSVGATAYWVWMRDGVQFPDWVKLEYPLTGDDHIWHMIWLAPGRTYEYKLQAAKGWDLGAYSNDVALLVPGGGAPAIVCR